jgi:hypothetical protein
VVATKHFLSVRFVIPGPFYIPACFLLTSVSTDFAAQATFLDDAMNLSPSVDEANSHVRARIGMIGKVVFDGPDDATIWKHNVQIEPLDIRLLSLQGGRISRSNITVAEVLSCPV